MKYSWKSLDKDHCELNGYLVDIPLIEWVVSKANAAQLHIGNQALPSLQRYVWRLHVAPDNEVQDNIHGILISLKKLNNVKLIYVPDEPFKNWMCRFLRSETGELWMNYERELEKKHFVKRYGTFYHIV